MTPGTPGGRRAEDDRLNTVITDVAVLRNDMGYARGMLDEIAAKMGSLLDRMEAGFSDLSQTPAGRAVISRLDDHDERIDAHDAEIRLINRNISSMLEDRRVERAEARTLRRLVKLGMSVVSAVATVLGALWSLHLLGWIK